MIDKLTVASVMYEANRALAASTGDMSHVPWVDAGAETVGHFIRGVDAVLNNPTMTAKEGHDFWVADHLTRGWTFGPVKDRENKKHPCLIPFEELSEIEKAKDHLYIAIVRALLLEQ